ncbi:unnamed protein product [Alopecurus aequalis]
MATSSNGLAGLLCFALMAAAATATQFRVGGAKGWGVPDATAEPYNAWAGRLRFQIGDQLLFVYPNGADSVLLVDQAAYNACNTTAYITKFEGGSTVFTFDRSGPFFFISGNQASCAANQKLIVVVLAASHTHTPPGLSPPTPPSSMPPTSAPPVPSPTSSPPSPPSMPPPSGAPMPSPMSPPSMTPPSGAPMPSPMSPPSMAPPMPTPESALSPTGSAPGAAPAGTPGSSPSSPPGSPGSPPSPGTPGGAPRPPADSTSPPGAGGANSTSGAAQVTAGLISTLAAGFGYAMLAI